MLFQFHPKYFGLNNRSNLVFSHLVLVSCVRKTRQQLFQVIVHHWQTYGDVEPKTFMQRIFEINWWVVSICRQKWTYFLLYYFEAIIAWHRLGMWTFTANKRHRNNCCIKLTWRCNGIRDKYTQTWKMADTATLFTSNSFCNLYITYFTDNHSA